MSSNQKNRKLSAKVKMNAYAESMLFISGITVTGFFLQLYCGSFNFYFLLQPVNIIIGVVITLISILGVIFYNNKLIKWITSIPFTVCLLAAILFLSLVMGLIPQHNYAGHTSDFISRLGFNSVTSSWPFVLLYSILLVTLGIITVKAIINTTKSFNKRNIVFVLNHAGLWIILMAAGLGAADMQKHVMYVVEGEVEWRVYSDNGDILELPVAVNLIDFDMDVYPPVLAVIDLNTGKPQPAKRPVMIPTEKNKPVTFNDWEISVINYIHSAVPSEDGYREVFMPGSTPAVLAKIENIKNGTQENGWIVAGNPVHQVKVLKMDEQFALVMAQPEPRTFLSKVNIYTEKGKQKNTIIEVNKPAYVDGWNIYQYGYDTGAGRLSSYSSFELVYDPWLFLFYTGAALLTTGSFGMIWIGKRRHL